MQQQPSGRAALEKTGEIIGRTSGSAAEFCPSHGQNFPTTAGIMRSGVAGGGRTGPAQTLLSPARVERGRNARA